MKPLVVLCRLNGKPFMAKRQTFPTKHIDSFALHERLTIDPSLSFYGLLRTSSSSLAMMSINRSFAPSPRFDSVITDTA